MQAITLATLTETTCGAACWHAKEEICRCSCGGANHGVLRCEGAEQPVRTCKIDGHRYELVAVGNWRDLYRDAAVLLDGQTHTIGNSQWSRSYPWRNTDKGSPVRLKYATALQCERWPELSAFKGLDVGAFYRAQTALLWKKV